MTVVRNKLLPLASIVTIACSTLVGCGGGQKTSKPTLSEIDTIAVMRTINQALTQVTDAEVVTSEEIDWAVGILPWDRFTLPTISPDGLHVAVQLGTSPSRSILIGSDNTQVDSTTIELHILDPMQGRKTSPLSIDRKDLLLTRCADDQGVLVEIPNGEGGRSIGKINWVTGTLALLVDDFSINAFPTINSLGYLAWSRRAQDEERFHLVILTSQGIRVIDDQKSDWLFPLFLGNDRLRAYRLLDGELALVEFDLHASNPLLTAMSLPILASGATRSMVWTIANSNPVLHGNSEHAFYHPRRNRMAVWQPGKPIESAFLAPNSFAAVPANNGTWLVATNDRVLRQSIGERDGIHLRNRLAIPIATTSNKWTHLLLIPDGNRLQVRALNLHQ